MNYYLASIELPPFGKDEEYFVFNELMDACGFARTIIDNATSRRFELPKGTYFFDGERPHNTRRCATLEEARKEVLKAIEHLEANYQHTSDDYKTVFYLVTRIDSSDIYRRSAYWALREV